MLQSGLSSQVVDNEPLARFLTSSSHYNEQGVKPGAFLPNPHDNQTSVFRHGPEPVETLWNIGDSVVGQSGRTLHGAAFISAEDVRAAELEVISEEPPPRHANITNWPSYDVPSFAKAAQKEISLILASKSAMLKRQA